MRALLVGYGEIGKSVHEVFSKYHLIDVHDPVKGKICNSMGYDLLLVAIPYSDKFVDIISGYRDEYRCKDILVFSTVPIGTCSKLGACHCPVEGKHPNLAKSIAITSKWFGGTSKVCYEFIKQAGFEIHCLDKPEFTEFLKLRSTTLYGVNIEFARYSKEVCDAIGLKYEEVKRWDTWVNTLYQSMGMPQYTRYILEPPEGSKGGHCVAPNAKLLNKQFPNELVRIVAED